MNKIKFLLLPLLVFSLILTSCGTEEDDDGPENNSKQPTLTLNITKPADGNNILPGDNVVINVVANQNSNTKKKLVNFKIDLEGTNLLDSSFGGLNQFKMDFSTIVPDTTQAGASLTYKFTIEDKDGQTRSRNFIVKIKEGGILYYTTTIMHANLSTVGGSFLNVKTNKVFMLSEAASKSAEVDILYYYGSSNAATLAAPSDKSSAVVYNSINSWTTKNTTTFKILGKEGDQAYKIPKMTDLKYAADLENVYTKSTVTAETLAKNLDGFDDFLCAFKLADGSYGVLKIVKVESGTTGKITIDVKVTK